MLAGCDPSRAVSTGSAIPPSIPGGIAGDEVASVEDGRRVPRALELVEAMGTGDQHHAVPEPTCGLALGRRGHDRAEEPDRIVARTDRDDRGADVHADPAD